MGNVITWLNFVLTILAFGIIGLLWKAIKAQKATVDTQSKTIEAQESIVNSFKAQSDYINKIQTTMAEMYKPETIQNIMKAREEEIKADLKKLQKEEILNELHKYKTSFERLVIMAAGFLFTDEKRFNIASKGLDLETFELDAINEIEVKYGFHKRREKMRILTDSKQTTNKP